MNKIKHQSMNGCFPIIFIGIATLASIFVYLEYFFNPCDLTIRGVTVSPKQDKSIVVYSLECGATTRFNTQVSLAPAGRKFSPDLERRFLAMHGRHDIAVTWLDEATVEVTITNTSEAFEEGDMFQRRDGIDGVAIRYK